MQCKKAASLDFPDPFFPTRAYLWPAFSWSLAWVRISRPSLLFALLLPLAAPVFAPPEVTVISRPWISSFRKALVPGYYIIVLSLYFALSPNPVPPHLSVVWTLNVKTSLHARHENGRRRLRRKGGHCGDSLRWTLGYTV